MKITTKSSLSEETSLIVEYLGRVSNIIDVDACITRLRVTLKDPKNINREGLMSLGANGIVDVSEGVQVIYGARAVRNKSIINDMYEF